MSANTILHVCITKKCIYLICFLRFDMNNSMLSSKGIFKTSPAKAMPHIRWKRERP